MHKRVNIPDYNPNVKELIRKKRVCAYARVSSEKEEAFHSLSAQIGYYQQKIAEHPDWEYVEVFSDRGMTGTKEDRPGFQAMLTACREHRVDIVLAKSITRFARNTVILLETVRELKSLGIDIHFEEERIETLGVKGEFMISVLAARAQEESRSASENQKWRIQKSYEKGIPVTGNALGYRLVDHQFQIDEEEEQIVLRIFSMYLSGKGCDAIAKKLTLEGVKTRNGKERWSTSSIQAILRNEKYRGDLTLQKSYVVDYITKKEAKNKGEKPLYYVKDAHDAIIDPAMFDEVQSEIKRRETHSPSGRGKYAFTSLVHCGKCGCPYKRRYAAAGTKYQKPVWICRTFSVYGKSLCDSQQIPENILIEKTCEVLGIDNLDSSLLRERIECIIVPETFTLVYALKDGSEKTVTWQHKSRRESWTPEMKEKARQTTIARNEAKYKQEAKEDGTQDTN